MLKKQSIIILLQMRENRTRLLFFFRRQLHTENNFRDVTALHSGDTQLKLSFRLNWCLCGELGPYNFR
jgi:hypothetical protein